MRIRRIMFVATVGAFDASVAMAGSPTREAQTLFEQGIALKQRGRYAEACPKLEESQRLDPGLGTQYHLADCYEKQGRTATAWSLYGDIARQAAVSGQPEREAVARERAAEVSARVPRITIAVPISSDVAGLEITRNGAPVSRDRWNAPTPVDPGTYEIVARVRDRTWKTSITLDSRGRTEFIGVPNVSGRDVAAVDARPMADEKSTSTDTQRAWGYGVGAVGLMGLGLGTVFAIDGGGSSTVTAATLAAGGAATGLGLFLVLSAKKKPDKGDGRGKRIVASASPMGVVVAGAF